MPRSVAGRCGTLRIGGPGMELLEVMRKFARDASSRVAIEKVVQPSER